MNIIFSIINLFSYFNFKSSVYIKKKGKHKKCIFQYFVSPLKKKKKKSKFQNIFTRSNFKTILHVIKTKIYTKINFYFQNVFFFF